MKTYSKTANKYLIPIAVLIISIYGIYLRLAKLSRHTLWNDEYYQLNQMLGSFGDLLNSLRYGEYCSYLSGDLYLTYPFFKIFYYNKWGLAIPHIIATIAGFYLLYLICKRYLKTIWGFSITFMVFCFNVNLVEHATEIRTYAVLPTLALGVFYSLSLYIESDLTLERTKKIIMGGFFILVIWFHVYGILIVLSLLSFHLLAAREEKHFSSVLKKTSRFIFVVLCIAMPLWLYSVSGPHLDPRQYNIDVFYFIPNPFKNLSGFLKGVLGNLVGFRKFYFLLIGLVFPFLFPYKERVKQVYSLIFAILMPISLIFLFDLKNKYWFIQRQFIWVMPLFAFFLGWSWESFLMFWTQKIRPKLRK